MSRVQITLALLIFAYCATAAKPSGGSKKSKSKEKANGVTGAPNDGKNLPTWPSINEGFLGNYSRGAVAADDGICSEIGRNILIRGGNAIDATIATVFCIGVTDAQSAGVGGGFFMTIYNKTSKTCLAIDAREKAPKAATQNMYVGKGDASMKGWLAVGVPGQIHGLYTAYKLAGSGRIAWRDLVVPTADLCHHGYPVTGALAEAIVDQKENIKKEKLLSELLTNSETHEFYKAGETIRQPNLAKFLYGLADASDPIKYFYNSNITEKIVEEFKKNGGIITAEDLREYSAAYGKDRPVITTKLGQDLVACGPPPPSGAAVTMAILNIMQGYNITPSKVKDFDYQVDTYHRFIEAMKFAYAARMSFGDTSFVKDALELARNITSPEYGEFVRSKITDKAHSDLNYYLQRPGQAVAKDHGTTHICALDREGNAASVTSTINLFFGAGIVSPSTGIIWNDQMDDFSTPNVSNFFGFAPSPNNFIAPGKRPTSSMSPLIIFNSKTGDVKMIAGSEGGSRIISGVSQLVMRTLWFGQNVREAMESPRLHHQFLPFIAEHEDWFPKVYLDKLIAKGHNFTDKGFTFEVANTAIFRGNDGRIYANSDPRKPGGYPSGV